MKTTVAMPEGKRGGGGGRWKVKFFGVGVKRASLKLIPVFLNQNLKSVHVIMNSLTANYHLP